MRQARLSGAMRSFNANYVAGSKRHGQIMADSERPHQRISTVKVPERRSITDNARITNQESV